MGETVQTHDRGVHAQSMMTGSFAWAEAARRRLDERLDSALRRTRLTGGAVIVAATVAADPALDPTALVMASRRSGEPWLCLEQPARDRAALAALGSLARLEASGPGRFDAL